MPSVATRHHTESEHTAALRSGSRKAFSNLYAKYAPMLLGFISRTVKDKKVAENILQMTFIAVWNNRQSIDNQPLLGWLMRLTRDTLSSQVNNALKTNLNTTTIVYTYNSKETDGANKLSGRLLEELFLNGTPLTDVAQQWNIERDKLKMMLRNAVINLKTLPNE